MRGKLLKTGISMVLAAAMMVTSIPASLVSAKEMQTKGIAPISDAEMPEPDVIECAKFVASGGQSGTDTWLIATNENGTNGTERSAAYIKDETATEAAGGLGSTRVGAMAFQLPSGEQIDPELISNATLTINVTTCNKDNMGSRKTRAGVFRVDQSFYDVMRSDGVSNSTATDLFPAVNNDYSKDATIFSKEWLSLESAGTTTFDVTEWVKEAIAKKDTYAIFRLQTVICGFEVSKNGEKAPTLSITSISEQQIVEQAKAELTLPESVKNKLDLPSTGLYGTTITWRSGNLDLIDNDGTVVQAPKNDTEVIMTATITKGAYQTTKEFPVIVKAREALKVRAEYTFSEEDLTDKMISDTSGNGFDAELKGTGASIKDGMLTLPGGGAGSSAAYVSIPKEVFVGQDTLTINVWLKNQTGSNNYSAMYFGTKTRHVDSASTADMPLNYWILNPAQPDGYFKSVWTDSDNAGAPYNTETAVSKTKTSSDWAMYTTVITPNSIKGYYNGVEVCNNSKTKTTTSFGADLVAYIGRSSYNDMFYKGGVYGVSVYTDELTQEDIQEQYKNDMPPEFVTSVMAKIKENLSVGLGDLSEVTQNLELPTQGEGGAEITWSSSNTAVIANDGTVVRPETANTEVTLTATIKLGGKTDMAVFQATVISNSKQSQLDLQVKHLTIAGAILEQNIELPVRLDPYTTVAWSSSNTDVIKIEKSGDKVTASVTRPDKEVKDATVTLKAVVTYEDGAVKLDASKDFAVTVRAEDYGSLMAYTNSKEASSLGNSLHLAYSQDFKTYTALNSNTGICFANNAGGSKNSNPNGLCDMYLFRKADGTYGMAARNSSTKKYIYFYDSTDLVHFTNERMLTVDNDVNGDLEISPYTYDGTEVTYAVYFKSGNKHYRALTKDFETVMEQQETEYVSVQDDTTGVTAPEGAVISDLLGVGKAEYQYVVQKLDVVKNTGIEKVAVKGKTGDDVTKLLPNKVKADYSDGTSADFSVDWNQQDLANVDLNKKGTYSVTGTVKQTQYPNPFIEQRADPCILKGDDGYYYFTASYPMKGGSDNDGYDKVVLRRAKTIEGLADAEEVTIWDCDWNPDVEKEYRYIWAPEIRIVDGNYYVFYTSSIDSSVWSIRPHVLKCTNPADIMNPDSWRTMGMMQSVESDGVAFSGFSLDMTVFENKGHWYVIWAQTDGYSSLFLAEIDPEEPWKCISESVKISVPEYSWERQVENVDEGPSVIKNNGKIYVSFSASGTGPEYCIGLLSIDENANMLDKNAWVKQPYPVLTSADVPGEYGPGHNSFTVDEEGNPIFVYHARGQKCYDNQCAWANESSLYDPCRDARLKRVHWAADGTPILKMSYEEELAPENRTITATITVDQDQKPIEPEIPVSSVTLDQTSMVLLPGASGTLTATVAPENATNQILSWASSNTKVAVVQDGKVTAKAVGNAVVVVMAANGKAAVCYVTVVEKEIIPATGVTLNQTSASLDLGKSMTLTATVAPANATDQAITWESSDDGVASVKDGKVTGYSVGTAIITASTENGKTATCKVTVKISATKLKLNQTKVTLGVNEKFTLKATVTPKNATNKVSWSVDKKSVASISSKGVITAKKAGKAVITAKIDKQTVKCTVTVKKAPKSIRLNAEKKTLKKGKKFQIQVTLPTNTASNEITYKSSGKKIATVSDNGKVTAKKKGKATITVKTFNNKKAKLKITVK